MLRLSADVHFHTRVSRTPECFPEVDRPGETVRIQYRGRRTSASTVPISAVKASSLRSCAAASD